MAKVTLDQSKVTALLQSPSGPVHKDFVKRVLKVHGAARRNCPVDTGRLRGSIRWQIGTDSKGLVAIVSTDADYAYWVHQGTKRMVGRPFLLNALKEAL